MKAITKLTKARESGRFAVTAECLPPRGANAEAVKKLASCFPPAVDAVVVADNPSQVRSSAVSCAAMLAAAALEPVLSLVTRDRNRIALESEVLGAMTLGVKIFLCLTGEHQALGDSSHAAGAFDIDSIQLCQALKLMAEENVGFNGEKIAGDCELSAGVAAHPYLRPMGLNLLRTKKKAQAGAQFMLTQAVFNVEAFVEWLDATRAAGVDTPIIASVLPLTSVENAKYLRDKQSYGPVGEDVIARLSGAADAKKEGIAICVEIAQKLKSVRGVDGIHILSGGCEEIVAQVIKDAELGPAGR